MSEPAARRRLTAVDLWNIPRVGTPAVAPSGAFVVVGVVSYAPDSDQRTERLHLIPTRSPELARPLTAPDLSSSEPCISPDGRTLAFVRKPHGGGEAQLHVMPLDGGEARRLTDLPLGASDPRWMPDGRSLVVLSPLRRGALTAAATRSRVEEEAKLGERPHVTEDRVFRFWDRWLTDGEVHHLFLVDATSGEVRDLIPSSERWFDLMDPSGDYDISPSGDEIAFAADTSQPPHDPMRHAIYTVPVAGGEPKCLTPDNPADDKRPRYSPDGRWLVYGAKRDIMNYADRVRIVRVDRATGEHTTLTEGWDCSPGSWEFADADTLIIEAEAHGRTCLYRISVGKGGTPELIAKGGTLHGIRPAADGFVYAQVHSMTRPPEIGRCPVGGGAVEVISRFTDEALSGFELGRPEEIEFAGAEGEAVHMYLLFPPGYEPGKPYPLVHNIHGGPYGMHADGWHWRWNAQTLAAPGYVLAMVNFHGSSSYGQRFATSILGDWGGKAAEDLLKATDLLVERRIADPARLAIAGGSFGGYMTCWLATRTDRFACAIAHAALYNLAALAAGDITHGAELEFGGAPWETPRDREALERWNPAAYTVAFSTPMLILHGEKDYRVPVQHALDVYGVLKARGVPARLVHYPDENHWILRRRNSLHWYGEFLGWLDRFLKDSRPAGFGAKGAARRPGAPSDNPGFGAKGAARRPGAPSDNPA